MSSSQGVVADSCCFRDVLGAEVVFAMGPKVATVRPSGERPAILLADQLDGNDR